MFAKLATLSALVASVAGHGYVSSIIADGVTYPGANPANTGQSTAPKVAGWAANNLDNGFIEPNNFGTQDIICHKSATPGQAYVNVKAGSKISFVWNTWPDSHKGPVIDYIASCGGECTTVSKANLKFVKLDQAGWISGSNPGTWSSDTLVKNKFTWDATIPSSLAPGNYVIRHEIIALHSAGNANGAQAYPQCINIKVTGSGSKAISGGASPTTFYKANDPGILFNLYQTFTSYTIPGPAVATFAKKKRDHIRDFFRA